MELNKNFSSPSLLVKVFESIIEFGNKHLTLSGIFFKANDHVFMKIEVMMALIIAACAWILVSIHTYPFWLGLAVCLLLIQRILEYFIVYSRNFILNRGRVFTHFKNMTQRGQWLILMFALSVLQTVLVFAIWYRFLAVHNPEAFANYVGKLDALYFSMITFFTIGYGDIAPISSMAKILVMAEGLTAFYTIIIVINGLISIHFQGQQHSD